MAELGVGTRVWIGWTTDENCTPDGERIRCTKGTITGGPLYAGEVIHDRGIPEIVSKNSWWVEPDEVPGSHGVIAEYLLHPIDDGEPVTEEESDLAEA